MKDDAMTPLFHNGENGKRRHIKAEYVITKEGYSAKRIACLLLPMKKETIRIEH
jgi:hypothetical protein